MRRYTQATPRIGRKRKAMDSTADIAFLWGLDIMTCDALMDIHAGDPETNLIRAQCSPPRLEKVFQA